MNNGFEPVGTHEARSGDRVRIYSAPTFVRPDGQTWKPIRDVAQIGYDPQTQVFRVECLGRWAELRPRLRFAPEAMKQLRLGNHHFGWVLDYEAAPKVLEWDLVGGPGAKETPAGIELAEPDGVKLGLFIADWGSRFGEGLQRSSGGVRIELTDNHAVADRNGNKVVDLDPTTIQISAYRWHQIQGDTWSTIRDASESQYQVDYGIQVRGCEIWGTYFIDRSPLQFDTSGYSAVRMAWLYLHWSSLYSQEEATLAHLSVCDEGSMEIGDAGLYGRMKTNGYEQSPIGAPLGGPGENWYRVLITGDKWESSTKCVLSLAHLRDVQDSPASGANGIRFDTDPGPYLEVYLRGPQSMTHYRRRRA